MKKMVSILAGLVMMAAMTAWAIPTPLTLSFNEGSSGAVTVVDGGDGDINPFQNGITYINKVGKTRFSISTGLYGVTDGKGISEMMLDGVDVRRTGAGLGDLVISLSGAAGAWPGQGGIAEASASTIGGSATFTALLNGNQVSNLSLPQGSNPFRTTEWFGFDPKPEDVIKLIASISPDGAGITAFNYKITPVPEPGTVMLLAAGFLGLAIYSKRRMNS